ncbi:TPA: hypothetical protein ACHWKL_004417, partial [Providencia stuartii]|uniref:hypothetical protein n=1 Tax=Providencia stuartii TaxID=588 RepID=UPI00197F70D3
HRRPRPLRLMLARYRHLTHGHWVLTILIFRAVFRVIRRLCHSGIPEHSGKVGFTNNTVGQF